MPQMLPGQAPIAYATQFRVGAPRVISKGKDITVSHSELFADHGCSAVGAFDAYSFAINPGNPAMFPWLSPIALRYERYKFRSLVFKYFSRSTTSNYGMVGCYVDHDPSDEMPADFKECCAQYGNNVTQVYMPMTSPVDLRKDNVGSRYVRDGSSESQDGDTKLYDVGMLVTYSDNTSYSNNNVCGYWVVDYTVDLSIPQIQDSAGGKFAPTDLSNPVATLVPTGHARANFRYVGEDLLEFDAPFEGTMEVQETTEGVIGGVPEVTLGGGPLASKVMVIGESFGAVVSSSAIAVYAIKVYKGTRVHISAVASGLTTFYMLLSRGAYDQYSALQTPPSWPSSLRVNLGDEAAIGPPAAQGGRREAAPQILRGKR